MWENAKGQGLGYQLLGAFREPCFPLSSLYKHQESGLKLPARSWPQLLPSTRQQRPQRTHLDVHFNFLLGGLLIACVHIAKGERPVAANFHLFLVGVVELHTLGHSLGLDLKQSQN